MEVTKMEDTKSIGLFTIIIGLLFIAFPMVSTEIISIIVGLSLLFFGISSIFNGINIRKPENTTYSNIFIIIGLIVAIFGFLFIFYIDALSFLIGIQFYLIGFILIILGITGLVSRMSSISVFTSILVLIMGIVAIVLAAFAMTQPIYLAIIIGAVLIIEGIALLLSD